MPKPFFIVNPNAIIQDLYCNPSAIHFIEATIDVFGEPNNIEYLCGNPNADYLIREHINSLTANMIRNIYATSKNPELIKEVINIYDINIEDWYYLVTNSHAIDIIESRIEIDLMISEDGTYKLHRLCSPFLSLKTRILMNPELIKFVNIKGSIFEYYKTYILIAHGSEEQYRSLIPTIPFDFYALTNPNAINYITDNFDNISTYLLSVLCSNKNIEKVPTRIIEKLISTRNHDILNALVSNPNAINIITKYSLHNIADINPLCHNPNACHLIVLEKIKDEYAWCPLSRNPNAFNMLVKYDYKKMNKDYEAFREEIQSIALLPELLEKRAKKYNISYQELLQQY